MDMKTLNQTKIYVLGNNYDGCLLTGDTDDRKIFTSLELDETFLLHFLNHSKFELGIRNAYLINSIFELILYNREMSLLGDEIILRRLI